MAASYPSSVKTYSAINGGDFVLDTHPEAAYDEITAIEQALLTAGFAHNLFPSTDAARDLGTSALQWRDLYIGRGIKFHATQNPSTDVNVLDDYEEGTWTPVIGGSGGTSGQTYVNQEGRYIKIGSLVWVSAYVKLSAEGTITGNVQIQGLPFTAENGIVQYYPGVIQFEGLATNWIKLATGVIQNTTTAYVTGIAAAAATDNTTNLTAADIGNSSGFRCAFCYRAAA